MPPAILVRSIGTDSYLHPDFGSGTYGGGPIGIPYTTVSRRQPKVRVSFTYADDATTYVRHSINPQGELKVKIDQVDKLIAEAGRSGNTGEVRRLMAEGMTLLSGRDWTETLDYSNSIVIRTEQTLKRRMNRIGPPKPLLQAIGRRSGSRRGAAG